MLATWVAGTRSTQTSRITSTQIQAVWPLYGRKKIPVTVFFPPYVARKPTLPAEPGRKSGSSPETTLMICALIRTCFAKPIILAFLWGRAKTVG